MHFYRLKLKYFILSLLFNYLLLASVAANTTDVNNFLKNLPEKDRKSLNEFFFSVMYTDHGSYTLFGDKPVAFSGYWVSPRMSLRGSELSEIFFFRNWQIWKKYENRLKILKYIFIEEPCLLNRKNKVDIFFINKKAFIKMVDEHIEFFKKFLGPDITGRSLLEEVERKKNLTSVIKKNQMLLGILLGYGVHNSYLFYRRDKILPFVEYRHRGPRQKIMPSLPIKAPAHSEKFPSLEEECKYLWSHLHFFGEKNFSLLFMQSLHFVAELDHPETKALKKKYNDLRGKISAIYAPGDFLEITLTELTSTDN